MRHSVKRQTAGKKTTETRPGSKVETKPVPAVGSRWQQRGRTLITCLLLALAVGMVFGQTLRHEFVNCDDDVYVTDNPRVATGLTWGGVRWAFQNLQAGFWHPLTWLSLMTDAQGHGLDAGGFHLTNVLLHLANTLLLFGVLRQMTNAHWASAFVAALFAVHPLHVESVAWISERKGLLSFLFSLLSLWAYVGYAQKARNQPPSGFRPLTSGLLWLSLLFFALALMSKTMAVTLPLVLLLLDYWPLGRIGADTTNPSSVTPPSASYLRLLLEKAPFFVLAVGAAWLTFHAEKNIGALSHGADTPLLPRLANAAYSSGWYLWRTLWPADLAVFYPYTGAVPIAWAAAAALLLVLLSALVLWYGRRHPYLVVGWFWYVLTLAPVCGLIQIGAHARADRYTYVPLLGVFLIVAWGATELGRRWRHGRRLLWVAGVASLGTLLVVARAQTAHWRDSVTLWSRALACAPEHFLSLNNLGNALAAKGRGEEAVPYYERALKLNPNAAQARVNWGNKLAAQGKFAEAIAHFQQALQADPAFSGAYYNLGLTLAMQGLWDEAIPHYERALQLKPDYLEARVNLGNALIRQGKLEAAVTEYERVLQLKPGFAEARYNLGNTLLKLERNADAVAQYERALQLKPDYLEAHHNLGLALAKQGKLSAALPHFQQALNLATARGQPEIAEDIRRRLESYQSAPQR